MASVVLVTGVGRYLGARIASRLCADAGIARVIGVDTVSPDPSSAELGRVEFVRADIRHPLIARVLDQAGVEVVVHTGLIAQAARTGDQTSGAAALLGACERARTVTRVVAASSTAVYGASRLDPAVFTEAMGPAADLPPGHARACADIEGHLRALARRRPDLTVATARLATIVGPGADTWLTRLLERAVVPSSLGFDPRLQLLHEYDAVEVLARLARLRVAGPVNVAGEGVLTLSQALRIARRLRVPVPGPALAVTGLAPRECMPMLRFGRVVDTTRLTDRVGYRPRYTTAEALYAHVEARPAKPGLATALAAGAHRLVARAT